MIGEAQVAIDLMGDSLADLTSKINNLTGQVINRDWRIRGLVSASFEVLRQYGQSKPAYLGLVIVDCVRVA